MIYFLCLLNIEAPKIQYDKAVLLRPLLWHSFPYLLYPCAVGCPGV